MPRNPKRVLITGAGSGIGRALAIEAAQRGMVVALCGRRQVALAGTLALLPSGQDHLVIPSDITIAPDRAKIIERVSDAWGALDILVNNAGIVESGPIDMTDDNVLNRLFQTNIIAPIALTRDAMNLLATAKPSRVVNIGSVFGDIPHPQFIAYSATKASLHAFSIALRREWARRGISVTYVAPRGTQTDAAAAFQRVNPEQAIEFDPPDGLARHVWQSVTKGRAYVGPPVPEKLYIFLQRFFPGVIDLALSY